MEDTNKNCCCCGGEHDEHDCSEHDCHDHDCGCGCGCEGEEDGWITLYDEDGKETNFFILDGVEHNDKMYIALVEDPDSSEEFILLRADTDENGEDFFNTIEDDEEFNTVVELLQQKMEEDGLGAFELEAEDEE